MPQQQQPPVPPVHIPNPIRVDSSLNLFARAISFAVDDKIFVAAVAVNILLSFSSGQWTVVLLLFQLLCVLPEPLKFFWFLSERREEIAAELVMSPFLIIFLPTESRSAEIRLSGLVGSSYGLSSTCVVVVVVWGL